MCTNAPTHTLSHSCTHTHTRIHITHTCMHISTHICTLYTQSDGHRHPLRACACLYVVGGCIPASTLHSGWLQDREGRLQQRIAGDILSLDGAQHLGSNPRILPTEHHPRSCGGTITGFRWQVCQMCPHAWPCTHAHTHTRTHAHTHTRTRARTHTAKSQAAFIHSWLTNFQAAPAVIQQPR